MRAVLVGSVEGSRVALTTLAILGQEPVGVVTLAPALAKRHSDYADLSQYVSPSRTELIYTTDINDPVTVAEVTGLNPDLVWVVGWSQLCGPEFLSVAQGQCIGYHPSLLPSLRGRAVIPWTILTGISETGGSLFWIDEGVDSGPILAQEGFSVDTGETATALYGKHMVALGELIRKAVAMLETGTVARNPQDHTKATYCAKRTWRDGLIMWDRSAEEVWTLIRASTRPYPGAFTFRSGQRFVIWNADLIHTAAYIGLPGQIQSMDDGRPIVMCGDGRSLLLGEIEFVGATQTPPPLLRVHERLGIDPLGSTELAS